MFYDDSNFCFFKQEPQFSSVIYLPVNCFEYFDVSESKFKQDVLELFDFAYWARDNVFGRYWIYGDLKILVNYLSTILMYKNGPSIIINT